MRALFIGFLGLLLVAVLAVASAIAFGGPKEPVPLASIADDVRKRDRSDAPQPLSFGARDGVALTYRLYRGNAASTSPIAAVLVHGSAGGGINMHEVARALQKAGIDSIAPDFRGHGGSGSKGDIAYVGQLEDDLADLLAEADRIGLANRRIIIGHSAGGGFVQRLAGGPLWPRFEGAILLAPFVGVGAPTSRSDDGWAGVGLPRILGLMLVNQVGVHAFDGLPALAFGVTPQAKPYVTSAYSFRLMQNFGPRRDWQSSLAKLSGPVHVLVGASDELFRAERYPDVYADKAVVGIVPEVSHMGITGEPAALTAVVAAARDIAVKGR